MARITAAVSASLSRRQWLKSAGALGMGVRLTRRMVAGSARIGYEEVLAAAPWAPRYGLGLIVFQQRLWVMGGTASATTGSQFNDIWSSEDGLHWRQELAAAPWQPRWGHAVFALAKKVWVIGGLAAVSPIHNLNDIWSSPDGKNWTREVADAPWFARHVWAWTIHRNRMYLLGGATDGSQTYRDVLSSEDGLQWRLEPIHGPCFVERKYHSAAAYRGQIVVAGGIINDNSQLYGSRYLNDVWASNDGRAWNCIVPDAPWPARGGAMLVAYMGRLFLIGGEMQSRYYAMDIWSTANVKDWRKETEQLAWLRRTSGGVAVFKDKVWIMGGSHRDWPKREGRSLNDIWTFETHAEV